MKQNFKTGRLIVYINLLAAVIFSSSCVKDYRDGETNFSSLKPSVIIAEGGLSGTSFGAAAITFPGTDPSDTAHFHVNYATTNVAPADEQVSLAVDPNAVTSYNSSGGGLQYELMPDSDYSFTATTVTVPKGDNYTGAIPVTFYPDKIDGSKNYMLPISITSAPSGTIMSDNQNTIYYHAIGNPLAGAYIWDFYRWNAAPDTTGPPNSTVSVGQPATASPVDPVTILLPEGYLSANGLGNGGISISFTYANGVISNPTAFIDATTQNAIDAAGFKVATAPTIVSYQIVGDASTHFSGSTFRVYFEIINSSGGDRKTINNYTKQ